MEYINEIKERIKDKNDYSDILRIISNKSNMYKTQFVECMMQGSKFDGLFLVCTKFTRSKMQDASMKQCVMVDVDFSGANIDNTDFEDSVLVGCNLKDIEGNPKNLKIDKELNTL